MRRFFLPEPLSTEFSLIGSDAHHIGRVLRLGPGDCLTVSGSDGRTGIARITAVTADEVKLILTETVAENTELTVKLWLAQGLAKADKMDYIVQKAVELGITGIIPLQMENCVVRYDEAKKLARVQRWQKIAAEAAKQCRRANVPLVAPVTDLKQCIASCRALEPFIQPVLLYEGETPVSLRQVLSASRQCSSFLLFVGPEGGFSINEVSFCQEAGAMAATLGTRILRTETASLAAIAIIMYHFGELGG